MKEKDKKIKKVKKIGLTILVLIVGISLLAVQIQAKTNTENNSGNIDIGNNNSGNTAISNSIGVGNGTAGVATAQKAIAGKPEIIKVNFMKTLPPVNATEINRREEILKKVHIHGPPIKKAVQSTGPKNDSQTVVQNKVRQPSINIIKNAPVGGAGIPAGYKATVHEPSEGADASGQNIWYTANWYAARSTDGGNSFSYVNPYADFSSFCCDQDVLYDANRNMILWYRQGVPDIDGVNYFRLGVSNDGGNTWFFYNVFPTDTNPTWTYQWWDYPQLAIDDKYLYIATNMFDNHSTPIWTRTVMLQFPLESLHTGSGFNYFYLPWTSNFGFGLAQTSLTGINNLNKMYFGTHNTNSNFRVFSWDESNNNINYYDRDITAWTPDDTTYLCPGPDRNNWCSRTDARVTGGWHAKGNIGFFWNVRQGNGFNYPYIESATFDDVNINYNSRPLIWSGINAYQYGTAAPDTLGNLGIGLFYGGGAYYPSHAVSIFDEIVQAPPPWILTGTNFGTNGPADQVWGDFIRVRGTTTDHKWTGTAFTLQGGTTGESIDPRYLVFSRSGGAGSDKQKLFVNGSDHGVYYKQYDGTNWGNWISLGGFVTSNPEGISLGSNTYVFARGGDNALYYDSFDGTSWSGWKNLGGFVTSNPEGVGLGSNLYVFVRGGDNGIYYNKFDGTSWSGWKNLGGVITSDPDAIVFGSNLYIFGKGGDNAEYYNRFDGTSWSGWKNLGGPVTSNSDTTVLGTNLYIFVRGGDNAEYYNKFDGTSWSGWKNLGGVITSDPDATASSTNLAVFIRGNNNAEYYNQFDGTSWTGWKGLGGIIASTAESISLTNRYVYVRGTNNAEYYNQFDGTSWSGWKNLGGVIISDSDAVSG